MSAVDPLKTTFGPAWHRRVAGLNVLSLKGNFYEMGLQHGTLLRDAVARGPVPYFRTAIERTAGASALGPARVLAPLIWPALQLLVGRRVGKKLPRHALDTVRGIAEGAGLSYQEMLDGCTMPDTILWLASRLIQARKIAPAMHHRVQLGLGCTSAVAWGDATVDGKLLHARNFDYHGVDCWPETASVLFYQPDDGQRYVSVAAAGIALGGVTAMNAAGLTLTVHQHMFTDRSALGGTPVGIAGDEVMRHATNLDDAERILKQYTPIGCWTYMVTDGKQREALCWEENPDRAVGKRVGGDSGTFAYSNIYLDPELGATEKNLYGSYWRHNAGRYVRAKQCLEERAGTLDPQGMAEILADTGDARCRIRDSIAMVMTVASVVFRPEDGVVWVGAGVAPTSRGEYVPFSLDRGDHAPDQGTLNVAPEAEAPRQAFEHYRRAFIEYTDRGDLPAARASVDAARALAPEQALYHGLAGLLAVQALALDAAVTCFDRALALGHPDPERLAAFHLWRARANDLAGKRAAALADYRSALGHHADPPVTSAAIKGLGRVYPRDKATHLHIDFAFADVTSP